MEMKQPKSNAMTEEKVGTTNEVFVFPRRSTLSPLPLQRVSSSLPPHLSSEDFQTGKQRAASLRKWTHSPSPRLPLPEGTSTFCGAMTEERPALHAVCFGAPSKTVRPYHPTDQTGAGGVPFQEGSKGDVEVLSSTHTTAVSGIISPSRKPKGRRSTPPSRALSASSFSSSSSRASSSTPSSCCGGDSGCYVKLWMCRCLHAICSGDWRSAVFSFFHFSSCPSHHDKHHPSWWMPGKVVGGEADEEDSGGEEEEDVYKKESVLEKRALVHAMPKEMPLPAETTGVKSERKVHLLSHLFSHAMGERRGTAASFDRGLPGTKTKHPPSGSKAHGRQHTTKAGSKHDHVMPNEVGTPRPWALTGQTSAANLCFSSPCGKGESKPHRRVLSSPTRRSDREGKNGCVEGNNDRREGNTWSDPPYGASSSSSSFRSSYPPSPTTPYVSSFSETSNISSRFGRGEGHQKEQEMDAWMVSGRWMGSPSSSVTVGSGRAGIPLSPLSAVRHDRLPFGLPDTSFLHHCPITAPAFSLSPHAAADTPLLPPFSSTPYRPPHPSSPSTVAPSCGASERIGSGGSGSATTVRGAMETPWPPLSSSLTREEMYADAMHIRHYGCPPADCTEHARSRRGWPTSPGATTPQACHASSISPPCQTDAPKERRRAESPPRTNATEEVPPPGWRLSIEGLQAFFDRYASFLPFRLRVSREEEGDATPPGGRLVWDRRVDEANDNTMGSQRAQGEGDDRHGVVHPLQLCLQGPLRTTTPFSSLLSVLEDVLVEDCDPQFPIVSLMLMDMDLHLSCDKGRNGAGGDAASGRSPLHGSPFPTPAVPRTEKGGKRKHQDEEWGKNVLQRGVLLDCLLADPTAFCPVGTGEGVTRCRGANDGVPSTAEHVQTDAAHVDGRHGNASVLAPSWRASRTDVSSWSLWLRDHQSATCVQRAPSPRRGRSESRWMTRETEAEEVFRRVTIFIGNILDTYRYRLEGMGGRTLGLTTIRLRRVRCSPSDFPLLCGVLPFDDADDDWRCPPSSQERSLAPNDASFPLSDPTRQDSRMDLSHAPLRFSSLSVIPLRHLLVEQCALTAVHMDALLWMTRRRLSYLSPGAPLAVVRHYCFFAQLEVLQLSGPLTQDCVEKLLRVIEEEAELLMSAATTTRFFVPTPISLETMGGISSSARVQSDGRQNGSEESGRTEEDNSSAIATPTFQLSLRVIRLPHVLLSVARRDPFLLSHPNIRVEALKSTEQ